VSFSFGERSVMAGAPVKFRCYRCNQLLGVSRSKVGSVVHCPKCAADLVVPELIEASVSSAGSSSNIQEPTPAFLSALASGVPLAIPDIRPEDIRVEPGVAWEPIGTAPVPAEPRIAPPELEPPALAPAPPEPPPPAPAPMPNVSPAEAPRGAIEPVVPPIRVEPPTLAVERTPMVRSHDLVIPRSVVAFWSLFVLLAQALAFVAGLLAGHYLWRVH
jgi:hypothetical protein